MVEVWIRYCYRFFGVVVMIVVMMVMVMSTTVSVLVFSLVLVASFTIFIVMVMMVMPICLILIQTVPTLTALPVIAFDIVAVAVAVIALVFRSIFLVVVPFAGIGRSGVGVVVTEKPCISTFLHDLCESQITHSSRMCTPPNLLPQLPPCPFLNPSPPSR